MSSRESKKEIFSNPLSARKFSLHSHFLCSKVVRNGTVSGFFLAYLPDLPKTSMYARNAPDLFCC